MQIKQLQQGLALMVLIFILALVAITYTIHALDGGAVEQRRRQKTIQALAEAKAALLGEVVRVEEAELGAKITEAIYLPNPDIAGGLGEGYESGNLGSENITILGKLPWRDLDFHAVKDGWGECLWYVVSGSYKKSPATSLIYNWDRPGQIDIIDTNGTYVANNIVSLIVAPGAPLDTQDRALGDVSHEQCGGNYDAHNYLDPIDSGNAINGHVNYFPGSPNSRQASDTNNKTFVLASNESYNDQFVIITVEDIFDLLVKRSDFNLEINNQINNAVSDIIAFGLAPFGDKGTANFNCAVVISTNPTFCDNWKEMFLLADVSGAVTVNSSPCNRVLIFGGQKTSSQQRLTVTDKSDPANYLEGDNLDAFNGVMGANYQGSTNFDGNNPTADIVRCVS